MLGVKRLCLYFQETTVGHWIDGSIAFVFPVILPMVAHPLVPTSSTDYKFIAF